MFVPALKGKAEDTLRQAIEWMHEKGEIRWLKTCSATSSPPRSSRSTSGIKEGRPELYNDYRNLLTIVCGGRDYDKPATVFAVLNDLRPSMVIHGECPTGADYMADVWCSHSNTHVARVPALWSGFGDMAGPLRNTHMLLLKPGLVIAFPGGAGTRNMTEKAASQGIPVIKVA